jgi:hypothetical protein
MGACLLRRRDSAGSAFGEPQRHVDHSGANLYNIVIQPMHLSNLIDDGSLIR